MTNTPNTNKIISYLIEEWDMANVPAEKREEYLDMLGQLLYKDFTDNALIGLEADQVAQLETLLDLPGTNPGSIISFYIAIYGEDKVQSMFAESSKRLQADLAKQ